MSNSVFLSAVIDSEGSTFKDLREKVINVDPYYQRQDVRQS